MGQRGPAPKPSALKQLHASGLPINENEPKPDVEAPECPKWLDAMARAEWVAIVPLLLANRILSRLDRAALSAYCQCYSRWQQAELDIQKYGTTFTTAKGYVCQRPEVGISNKALELMSKFLAKFGLSPSDRTKVSSAPESLPDDPAEKYFRSGSKLRN